MSRHARNTLIYSSLTMLSRVSGLLRQMVLLLALGTTRLNDAYQLAYMLPFMLYEFAVGGLLSAILIPLLVREQQKHGKDSAEAWQVANLLLGTVGAAVAVVSLLVILFAPDVTYALTFLDKSPKAVAARELAEFFVRYFAPQMLFIGLNAVLQAILNSHEAFAITGVAPILNNVVVIIAAALYWAGMIGKAGLAVGTTGGVAAMTLLQLLWLRRIGMPFRPHINFRDPVFKTITGLGKPMLAMSVANFVGTSLRANLLYTVAGLYTVYSYCFGLIMMPYGIFAVSIATVLFPAMSRAVADEDERAFSRTLSLGFRWTALVMAPVAVGLCILAEPVVRVLYERGEFSYADSLFMASFLRWYALSILPYALVVYATRAFYARNDTLTPAMINIGGVILNTTLNFLLMKRMGGPGIALSAVISYSTTTAVSLWILRQRVGAGEARAMVRASVKIATASAAMGFLLWAGWRLTAPEVATLDTGSRYPAPIVRKSPRTDYLVLRNREDWVRFWDTLGTHIQAPGIDFSKKTVVALLGPQSRTTTTLTLLSSEETTTGMALIRARVNMPPDRKELAKTLPKDAPTSPPFLVAAIRPAVKDVQVDFVFQEVKEKPSRLMSLLKAPGLLRTAFLIAAGALLYFAIAAALRTEELASLQRAFLEKLRRRRGNADRKLEPVEDRK